MYAQSASVTGLGAGTLAATGYNSLALALGAVTLMFSGISLMQLARRPGKVRP